MSLHSCTLPECELRRSPVGLVVRTTLARLVGGNVEREETGVAGEVGGAPGNQGARWGRGQVNPPVRSQR